MTTIEQLSCIATDWGTTNRRAWALGPGGEVLARRSDGNGLLGVEDRRFADSFLTFCGEWLDGSRRVPVIMGGMVGSKLGWKEAPYLQAPIALSRLGEGLCSVGEVGNAAIWIVPGVARDDATQPEVMRGEDCEILGALQSTGADSGIFLLPGTHTKWAVVEGGRLVDFRTYMTGELFGLLRKSGTLSQLMEGDSLDMAAFHKGVARAASPESGHLLHSLFSVRSLGLFERLPRTSLAGYMSGILIGSELRDAALWLKGRGAGLAVTGIGASSLLQAYRDAASLWDLQFTELESAELLPQALFSIAKSAGLLRKS